MAELPAPPGLGLPGAELWKAVTAEHTLEPHELVTLREAAHVRDAVAGLQKIVDEEGLLDSTTGRAHVALVEARHQRNLLRQLMAQLKVVAGEEEQEKPLRRYGRFNVPALRSVRGPA